jgi:N-acetyl-anhydromuramyl-L-alanine amidase AmpD
MMTGMRELPYDPKYPVISARHFTTVNRTAVDLVVLHSMEAPEKPGTARAVAWWFAGQTAPQASAHYCVDNLETIACVPETQVAWQAPGANGRGVGVEMAGYAAQTPFDWRDPYSMQMLTRAAVLVAEVCWKWDVPRVLLGPPQLLAGSRGIATHRSVSEAWKKSNHTDPGVNFPQVDFLGLVETAYEVIERQAVQALSK